MSSELKLVSEDTDRSSEQARMDIASLNPIDALNRRDIELIKKSLAGMHRDSEELRSTIVALHQRDSVTPSKSFFLALGLVGFIVVGVLLAARPELAAALQHVPVLARLADKITAR